MVTFTEEIPNGKFHFRAVLRKSFMVQKYISVNPGPIKSDENTNLALFIEVYFRTLSKICDGIFFKNKRRLKEVFNYFLKKLSHKF